MSPPRSYQIDVIAGDGIGQEVMPAAIRCVDTIAAASDFSVVWRDRDWGSDYYRAHGRMMPTDGIDQLADGDATLLGAVGAPDIADDVTLWGCSSPSAASSCSTSTCVRSVCSPVFSRRCGTPTDWTWWLFERMLKASTPRPAGDCTADYRRRWRSKRRSSPVRA